MDSHPAARLATLARTLGGPPPPPTIIIVGGAVLDVTAAPSSRPAPGGSVPGAVTVTPGGVGLNMARGVARLLPRSRVLLVSAVVNDAAGAFLGASARAARVDTTHLATLPPSPSAPRTAVVATLLDAGGDVAASVADVAVLEHGVSATQVATATCAAVASAGTAPPLVVVDGNLPPVSLAAVASATRVTLFEPVSLVKAARAVAARASTNGLPSPPPFTCALATPNLAELTAMARATGWSGAEPRAGGDVASVARAAGPAARAVLASRVAVALLITAGPAGAVLIGPREVVTATPLLPALLAATAAPTPPPLTDLVAVAVPAAPVDVIVSTGGAGDAAAAGALAALVGGSGAAATLAAACAAAAQALADRAAAPPLDAGRVAAVAREIERLAQWVDL